MPNILLEGEEYLLSTTIEANNILSTICERHNGKIRFRRTGKVRAADIKWCDIIVSVRSMSALSWQIARLAKKIGKFHILLIDDDLLGLDEHYGRYGAGIWPKRKEALKKTLAYTDCIWTCNLLLGEKSASYSTCKRFFVVNAAVPADLMVNHNESAEQIKIVYYVNDGSTDAFDQYISPVMPLLAEKYGNRISLTLMTLHPDIRDFQDKMPVRLTEHMTYPEFRKFLANEKFDIGICPLDDIGFNQYKYINKYIEYTISGIAGIYSDCRLYASVVRDGETGILCGNSSEQWLDAFSRLIDDAELRRYCISNAQKQLREEFSVDGVISKIVGECPEILNYNSDHRSVYIHFVGIRIAQFLFTLGECWYFAKWSIKNGGISMLLKRIWRYFNRVISSTFKYKKLYK